MSRQHSLGLQIITEELKPETQVQFWDMRKGPCLQDTAGPLIHSLSFPHHLGHRDTHVSARVIIY